jgi:hypothetical protein
MQSPASSEQIFQPATIISLGIHEFIYGVLENSVTTNHMQLGLNKYKY